MREREDANRTREAGHLDEIQGAVANTQKFSFQGAVGFIVWLDDMGPVMPLACARARRNAGANGRKRTLNKSRCGKQENPVR